MGEEEPREGEVNQATIEVCGPFTPQEWEAYKRAIRECLGKFKKHDPRIICIKYEKK